MSSKAKFSVDEWSRIAASPMLVCAAVSASDPSGLWGLIKEASAGGFALVAAKQEANGNALAKELADEISSGDARTTISSKMQEVFKDAKAAEFKDRALAELRSVAAIIDIKAPDAAPAFKTWLQGVAQKAAEAAKEGGFMGFGGVAVSDAEKATLAEISEALTSS